MWRVVGGKKNMLNRPTGGKKVGVGKKGKKNIETGNDKGKMAGM